MSRTSLTTFSPGSEDQMRVLERRATSTRKRLLRAVDALDERRRQVMKLGEQAKDLAVPVGLATVGIVALFGASIFVFGMAIKARRRRPLSGRVSEVLRGLDLARRPPLGRRVFEKVALTLAGIASTEIAKYVSKNALDGRTWDGRLVVGRELEAHHRELSPP
jgi:hypothetical protein